MAVVMDNMHGHAVADPGGGGGLQPPLSDP